MRLKLFTLVDITETGERRGPNKVAIGQQSNYDTVIQVIGLRSNPEPETVIHHTGSLSGLDFGKQFKGPHSYWELEFRIPDDSNTVETLQDDFDLVPIITSLTETAKINISVFKTKDDAERNIVFKYADNN